METCMRGFSFMPNNRVEAVDLQYIEEHELERTWKTARRERHKQREQKIWEEFIKEKDIVDSVSEDDQYQFLEQLPESYLKEMMELELQKMKKELKAEEDNKMQVQECAEAGKRNIDTSDGERQQASVVTFIEEEDTEQCGEMFHIFDEEKDEQFGEEDGALNETLNSPSTVREIHPEPDKEVSPDRRSSDVNTSSTGKSSENVSNVIESSIYCAKVKDLRIKINDQILEMICALDRREIFSMEREDIDRMMKRSVEFCSRFNRIYMYQLQRQMHDIKRNNNLTLPFAKHTQFQSQMIRVVSLHQNLLQAFQVFHKAVQQTWCGRESGSALRALMETTRSVTSLCSEISRPRDLTAANVLYNDNILSSCDKLEEFVNEYTTRCEEFLHSYDNVDNKKKSQKLLQNKNKKRPITHRSSSKPFSESDGRLSMYSLDTLRMNTKPSSSKDMQSGGASRTQNSVNNNKIGPGDKNEQGPKSQRKTPRCRRPLMRDPQAGRPRPPREPKPPRSRDYDICTMVEQVEPCVSSHASRDASPCSTVRFNKTNTPRTNRTPRKDSHDITRKSQHNTPRRIRPQSPKFPRSPSPKIKQTLNSILSDKRELESIKLIPASKIQNATKKRAKQEENYKTSEATCEGDTKIPSQIKTPNAETSKIASSNQVSPSDQTRRHVLPEPAPNSVSLESPSGDKKDREGNKGSKPLEQCEVSKLLKQLCSGDCSGNRTDRTGNAKNAQLLFMRSISPHTRPTTPHLLRILEETIQKKVPKSLLHNYGRNDDEKYRMNFNITEKITDNLFQYRTKFVQHMLTSPMYANSAVGKPWEMIGSISEHIIDEVLQNCVKEMELKEMLQEFYKRETSCVRK